MEVEMIIAHKTNKTLKTNKNLTGNFHHHSLFHVPNGFAYDAWVIRLMSCEYMRETVYHHKKSSL